MDMPQLSQIDPYARVSPTVRADEARAAHAGGDFHALIIGEDAAGRRRSHHPTEEEPPRDEAGDESALMAASGDLPEAAIEMAPEAAPDPVLPEDAQDPQELRALLGAPY